MKKDSKRLNHTFEPVYDEYSKVLILGTFPSIKSREVGFYYSHPQNRFWRVLANIFNEELPITIEEKKNLLKKHHIALFDVCASCTISASSDASIKNVKPNDLSLIINNSKIKAIFLDGKKARELYDKFFKERYDLPLITLPSTSPANATKTLDDLIEAYQVIIKYL